MTGLLLNPAKTDLSPEGLLPHESAMHPRARTHAQPRERTHESLVDSPLVLPARLKRLLNGWIAAAIAYRERQVTWLALHRAGARDLNNKRIYRGPIDDALERAARLRERRRLKRSLSKAIA